MPNMHSIAPKREVNLKEVDYIFKNYEAMEWEDLEAAVNLTKAEIQYVVAQLRAHGLRVPRRHNVYQKGGFWKTLTESYVGGAR